MSVEMRWLLKNEFTIQHNKEVGSFLVRIPKPNKKHLDGKPLNSTEDLWCKSHLLEGAIQNVHGQYHRLKRGLQ